MNCWLSIILLKLKTVRAAAIFAEPKRDASLSLPLCDVKQKLESRLFPLRKEPGHEISFYH